jgi:hypothetical protein
MKKLFTIILLSVALSMALDSEPQQTKGVPSEQSIDHTCQWVNGYYRKNGTFVQGYYRCYGGRGY